MSKSNRKGQTIGTPFCKRVGGPVVNKHI